MRCDGCTLNECGCRDAEQQRIVAILTDHYAKTILTLPHNAHTTEQLHQITTLLALIEKGN